jgi:hypothetical protein
VHPPGVHVLFDPLNEAADGEKPVEHADLRLSSAVCPVKNRSLHTSNETGGNWQWKGTSMDAKELVQVLVLIAAVAGFLFGVYQYRQAQKWKRLEFAATQLQRMYEDPELVLAGMFNNYSARRVPLPEKHWDYYDGKVFDHDCRKMYRLMSSRYEPEPDFFIYNDAFERLFEYLEQIYAFIELKLIKVDDVRSLDWIIEDLVKPTWAAQHGIDACLFIRKAYLSGNHRLIKLMNAFGYETEGCLKKVRGERTPQA